MAYLRWRTMTGRWANAVVISAMPVFAESARLRGTRTLPNLTSERVVENSEEEDTSSREVPGRGVRTAFVLVNFRSEKQQLYSRSVVNRTNDQSLKDRSN